MGDKSAVRERPILFSSEMVRAILEGRKTQTRRVLKRQPLRVCFPGFSTRHNPLWPMFFDESKPFESVHCPYGNIGDRLWVRETWQHYGNYSHGLSPISALVRYAADAMNRRCGSWPEFTDAPVRKWWNTGKEPWSPAIHMPRWASRIDLEIVRVRVERVQQISLLDCQAEGIFLEGDAMNDGQAMRITYRELWDKINAKRDYSWESNPWVWVIEFRPDARANQEMK